VTRLLRTALGNRGIARLEAGWAFMSLGQWTFSITLALYAYYEEGAGGVAAAVAVRMLPAALLGPLADRLSASLGPRSVLAGAALLRFALLEVVALVVWKELPFPLLLALAAGFELAGTVQRPARTAMLIGIARAPAELAAATAGRFTDYVGFFAGGLLAGLLVAGSGLDVAFAVAGAAYLAGAAVFFTLAAVQRVPEAARTAARAVPRDPWLRVRVALFGTSTLVQSMLELLLVITALDVLAIGSDGVGWLRAAFAFGGIAGGAAAVALLRRGRLALGLATGLALAGVPLALVPAWPRAAPALVLLALLGGGYALVEAALLFLTQRLAPPAALARLAALEELVYPLARAAGAGLAALLVVQLGDTEALVVAGALLPLAALASLRALRGAEQRAAVPEREFRLLRGVACFAPLPTATVENLAACARAERFEAGHTIDRGFHVIGEGAVELRMNGGSPERLGAGDSFGLDSLLRDAERSTASAVTPVDALTIARADFVSRVTPPARAAVRAARAR
jgi:predicted MFS family arabinose efflux permease